MTTETIHTCSYECERPECIRAQRDELVAKVEALRAENKRLANALQSLLRYVERCREAGVLVCDDIGPEEWARYELEHLAAVDAGRAQRIQALVGGVEVDLKAPLQEQLAESKHAAAAQAAEIEALRTEVDRLTCELMDAITRADKLAEALRELVEVFSESGMYDEEVFDKARAALAQEQEAGRG